MSLVEIGADDPTGGLRETDVAADPFVLFSAWLEHAVAANLPQPYAVTLATATRDGRPSARMVLLRGLDPRGFVFFTNYESRKGLELADNPRAALVMYWAGLERQVRVEGPVVLVSAEESNTYFRSRPRGSCLSAVASPPSSCPSRSSSGRAGRTASTTGCATRGCRKAAGGWSG